MRLAVTVRAVRRPHVGVDLVNDHVDVDRRQLGPRSTAVQLDSDVSAAGVQVLATMRPPSITTSTVREARRRRAVGNKHG